MTSVRSRWAGVAVAMALVACGGDGCPTVCFPELLPIAIAWEQPGYTLLVSRSASAPVSLTTTLRVEGYALTTPFQPSVFWVEVAPSGGQANPSAGDGPWPITITSEQHGLASVTFTAKAVDGPGSYPIGTFTFKARFVGASGTVYAEAQAPVAVQFLP